MGSEAFARLGLGRSKEGALDYPEKYTVIGVDIDADKLIAKYKGSRNETYAREVVEAVVQKYRTAKPPPSAFVRTLTGGVNEPVIVCDLGPDAKGKSWAVVVDGRQRCIGLRMVNDDNASAKPPLPRLQLSAVFRAFKREGAGLSAAIVKVVSNVRVARTASQRAEDAADLAQRGVAHDEIAPLVEAQDAAEVAMLLALAECAPEVQTAIDRGEIPLKDALTLAKVPQDEQARRVARKTAGTSRRAQNEAAAPRAKTRPARVLESVEAELLAMSTGKSADDLRRSDAAAVLAWARGVGEAPAWLAKAIESAEGARSGKRTGEKAEAAE